MLTFLAVFSPTPLSSIASSAVLILVGQRRSAAMANYPAEFTGTVYRRESHTFIKPVHAPSVIIAWLSVV